MHISATRLERCWTVYDEDTVMRRRRVAAISVSQFAHGALFCRSHTASSVDRISCRSANIARAVGRRRLRARVVWMVGVVENVNRANRRRASA